MYTINYFLKLACIVQSNDLLLLNRDRNYLMCDYIQYNNTNYKHKK